MYQLLRDLSIVEVSSFVASPTAGLYCAQMGADVIRVDQIGGGLDYDRYMQTTEGRSLAWENLNRAKKSVALDLRGFRVDLPPAEQRRQGFLDLTRHVAAGDIAVDVESMPLQDVAEAWPRWYALNREVVGDDPDHILPGQRLVVPAAGADR